MPKFITQHLDSVKGGRSIATLEMSIRKVSKELLDHAIAPSARRDL